ncbi:hypothetical protein DMB42_13735 [Nonomuraea sp. WAC 01424]|nr:hypothetical protein DMB42_13735 [Nonomuraea sp. WAC 01424]
MDPDDRLLMIRVQNDGVIVVPGHPAPAFFWILPGGGLEPGETFFPPGLPKLLSDVLNGSGRLPSEPLALNT